MLSEDLSSTLILIFTIGRVSWGIDNIVRGFVGVSMSSESVPDASLICKELMRSWFREHGVGPPKLRESPV